MRWCVVRWRGHLVYCLRDITPRENTIQSHGKGVVDKRTPPALLTAAHRSGVPTPVMVTESLSWALAREVPKSVSCAVRYSDTRQFSGFHKGKFIYVCGLTELVGEEKKM